MDFETFILKDIQSNEAVCRKYLSLIPTGCSFLDSINAARDLCPELRTFSYRNQDKFNGLGARDKGSMGKMAEFYLFGQMPNSDSSPDLSWGADIKGTHFKTNKQGHYNAKERLTITNCGDRNDYSTFEALVSAPDVRSCKYYPKIRRAVLCVFKHRGGKYNGLDENLSKTLLCCFAYDLEEMPEEITAQIDADFEHIQSTIRAGAITQAGQIFLHTAPHGSGHGSGTRALAFNNKFVTKLVSIYTGKPITVKGRSWFVEKQHF